MNPRPFVAAVALVVCSGCLCGQPPAGGDGGPPDAAVDAGPVADAGVSFDDCDGGAKGAASIAAAGLDVPRRIAFDGVALYISQAGAMTLADGQVLRLALDGGAAEPLATGFRAPDGIAADELHVYVVDGDGLWRITKADGTKLAIDPALAGITNHLFGDTEVRAASGKVVVATGLRGLVAENSDGSQRVVLYDGAPGTIVRGAAIEGATVYFLVSNATESGLFQVPLDGSTAATRVSPEAAEGRSLAVSATAFVWTEGSGGLGRVVKLDRTAGATPVVLASGLSGPARPVLAGQFVYFKDATSAVSDLFFRRASLCNPGSDEIVGPSGVGPGDLLFDGTRLWFTSAQTAPNGFAAHLP